MARPGRGCGRSRGHRRGRVGRPRGLHHDGLGGARRGRSRTAVARTGHQGPGEGRRRRGPTRPRRSWEDRRGAGRGGVRGTGRSLGRDVRRCVGGDLDRDVALDGRHGVRLDRPGGGEVRRLGAGLTAGLGVRGVAAVSGAGVLGQADELRHGLHDGEHEIFRQQPGECGRVGAGASERVGLGLASGRLGRLRPPDHGLAGLRDGDELHVCGGGADVLDGRSGSHAR